jgi:hypothetical protein
MFPALLHCVAALLVCFKRMLAQGLHNHAVVCARECDWIFGLCDSREGLWPWRLDLHLEYKNKNKNYHFFEKVFLLKCEHSTHT